MIKKHKIIVGITGASGSIYAKMLFDKLQLLKSQINTVSIIMSENAKTVWNTELGSSDYSKLPFEFYKTQDFMAPFASGSSNYNIMIICPCSMGTMGRIASGVSNDLMTRSADVILKEKRKLILITRENPLSMIHINNMRRITEAGGIICPASPSFYSQPKNIEEACSTVIDRVIKLSGLYNDSFSWGEKQ